MRTTCLLTAIVLMLATRASGIELVWNDDAGIHRSQPGGVAVPPPLFATFETRGIAHDPISDQLFWTDVLPLGSPLPGGAIRSGSTHGGDVMTIVAGLTAPSGVAIDPQAGKVYWTDLGDAQNPSGVYSANLDGSHVQRLIIETWMSEISGIALDIQQKQLYVTYVNPMIDSLYPGGIARADLDGSDLRGVLSGLIKPEGIAIDSDGKNLYWVDAGGLGNTPDGAIETANLQGIGRRKLLGGVDQPLGIALDPSRQNVYWTESSTGKIQRTTASRSLPFYEDVVTGLTSPTALVVIAEPANSLLAACAALLLIAVWRR